MAQDQTANNERALATARRELGEVYRELARAFCDSEALFAVLHGMAAEQCRRAMDNDQWADCLQTQHTGGEA